MSAGHCTTNGVTNTDVRSAGAMPTQHWIKRDQFENVDRLQAKFRCNPSHSLIADESEMFLPKMEQGQRRASLLIGWIMPDGFIHLSLQLGGNACARRVHGKKLVG